MFQTKVIEEIKTYISCSVTFFKNRSVYEIMWRNNVEPGRLQVTIGRMRIACCVRKATNALLKYVKRIAFPLQQWLHKRTSVLCCTYIACLVSNICEDMLPILKSQILNFSLTSFVSSASRNSQVIIAVYYNSNQDLHIHGSFVV